MCGHTVFHVLYCHADRLKTVYFVDIIHDKNVVAGSGHTHLGVDDVIAGISGVQEHHPREGLNLAPLCIVLDRRLKNGIIERLIKGFFQPESFEKFGQNVSQM